MDTSRRTPPADKERAERRLLAVDGVLLAGAVALGIALAGRADWNLLLLGTLLAVALISDLTAVTTKNERIKLSASFLAIVTAIVFCGATPAALIACITIIGGWLRPRYAASLLVANLAIYAWFPLIAGMAFDRAVTASGTSDSEPLFYLLVFGLFAVALLVNFLLVGWHVARVDGRSIADQARQSLVTLLPSELASAVLALAIAYVYPRLGTAAVALFGIVLLVFQRLIGALLLSQERADLLERRAEQLAQFQVGLLTALLRTLDLRDRMTARHSAAVARYAREMAAHAGMSIEEQELAHTAGLLHDIGKFILPDRVLKGATNLTEEEWQQIRRHPYEGARIVGQIDGFAEVSEIILAHHERMDGGGYPRGLRGEEIPEIARIISVADTYDVMTARDSYRRPVSSTDAIEELRRVAGKQLDARFVAVFIEVLESKELAYRHGEDADFEAELAAEQQHFNRLSRQGAPARDPHLAPRRAAIPA